MKKSTLLILLASIFNLVQAQNLNTKKYAQGYFSAPLPISPPSLSGSFGEIRGNHFHAANDYRTNQREGYPVFASADGYVSRIKTSAFGYGHGLYINHPNGYTTVYGHLSKYAPKIETVNKAVQYQFKSFEIDTLLNAEQIPVKKGEIIGYSGNTGGSGGPHLHFEIRRSKDEEPTNPQLFGLTVADQIAPDISNLYVYQLNNQPFNNQTPKKYFALQKAGNHYTTNRNMPIVLQGETGFGITTFDTSNGHIGKNGTYQVELYLDDDLIFASKMEHFSFNNSRAVNSFIDYPAYVLTKAKIQKSFVEPNNPLNVYLEVKNEGKITLKDSLIHRIKYVVCDIKGNVSDLSFTVKSSGSSSPNKENTVPYLSYKKAHSIAQENIKVEIPKDALYDDIPFYIHDLKNSNPKFYSDMYEVYTKLMPLQKDISVAIKADRLPEKWRSKALLVSDKRESYGGGYEDGYIKTSSKIFGNYAIAIDSIPPNITSINMVEGKNMSKISKAIFKISDDLSGIKSYNGYIDGQWVLLEYDGKTGTIFHIFEPTLPAGPHKFEVEVRDNKDNLRKLVKNFIR